jgi:hypothetical protein
LQGRGGEYDYGRQLYRALQDAGLAAVQAEGRVQVLAGGTAAAELFRLSFLQVREPLVGTGALTTAELDDLLAWLERPEFVALFGCVVAAWGRRTAR